jgi:hypothetical protein
LWGQVSDVIEEAGSPPMVPAHSHGGYKWSVTGSDRCLFIYLSINLINLKSRKSKFPAGDFFRFCDVLTPNQQLLCVCELPPNLFFEYQKPTRHERFMSIYTHTYRRL